MSYGKIRLIGAYYVGDTDVFLWEDNGEILKRAELDSDDLPSAIDAMQSVMRYNEAVFQNPPIGSWNLYVEDYAFLDDQGHAEYLVDLVPFDGLSKNKNLFQVDAKTIDVTCTLADDAKKGPRSWRFQMAFNKDIVPEKTSIQLYCKSGRMRITVIKKKKEFWLTPGKVHAPVTKRNYSKTTIDDTKKPALHITNYEPATK